MLLGGLAALAVALAAIYLLVLKGSEETIKLDPARGELLAHAAIPSSGGLPGSGWDISAEDDFDDGDDDLTVYPACADLVRVTDEVEAALDPQKAGEAQREYTLPIPRDVPDTTVEYEVTVYRTTQGLSSALGKYAAVFTGPNYARCFQAALDDPSDSTTGRATSVNPSASAPAGGVRFALHIETTSGGSATTVRLEYYVWQFGNSIMAVTVAGERSEVTPALVRAAVSSAQSSLDLAASKNPPTPASARVATETPRATSTPASGARLSSLRSYRYTLRIAGAGSPLVGLAGELLSQASLATPTISDSVTVDVSGAFVSPDRAVNDWRVGGLSFTLTYIGRDRWTTRAGTITGPNSASRDSSDISLSNQVWDDGILPILRFFACDNLRETVNGQATGKCVFRTPFKEQISSFLNWIGGGPNQIGSVTGSLIEVWLAEDGGHPVRVRAEMTGLDGRGLPFNLRVDLDVTNVNSAITINPPR